MGKNYATETREGVWLEKGRNYMQPKERGGRLKKGLHVSRVGIKGGI